MQRLEQIRWELELAIDKAKNEGYIIAHGTFRAGNCICPLTALDPKRIEDAEDAAQYLGVSRYWVESFIDGLDGHGPNVAEPEAYQLGTYFRLKHNFPVYWNAMHEDL